jgi:hypothetical protein
LAFGPDDVSWKELASDLWQFFIEIAHYPGRVILIISSCGADRQTITEHFAKNAREQSGTRPAAYVLTTVSNNAGEVYWGDSVVAWSIFYHQIGAAVLTRRGDIQTILDKIKLVGVGGLKYFRWDRDRYLQFKSKEREYRRSASQK